MVGSVITGSRTTAGEGGEDVPFSISFGFAGKGRATSWVGSDSVKSGGVEMGTEGAEFSGLGILSSGPGCCSIIVSPNGRNFFRNLLFLAVNLREP